MGGKGNKNGKGRHHGNTHGHGTNNQQNSNSQNSQNPVSRGPAMHQHEFVDQSDSIERDYLNSLFHKNQKGGGKHGGKNNQMKGGGGNGKGDGAGGKSKSGNTSGTDQDATPRETDYTSVDSQHGVAKGGDLDTLGEVYDHQGYHGFPNALAGGKTGGGKQSSAVTVDEIRGSELLARPTGMSQTSQSAALQAGSPYTAFGNASILDGASPPRTYGAPPRTITSQMGAFHPSGTSDQASANGNSGNEEQVEFANTYMVDHPEAHELLTGSEGYNTGNEGGKDFTTSTPDANTTRGQESTATRPTAWYNLWNYASDLGGGDASANQQATIGTGDINVAGDRDATSGRTTTQPTGHASAAYARGPDGSGRSPVSLGYGHGESSGNLDKQGSSFFSRLSSRVAGAFGGGGSRTEGTNAISMRASVGQQTGTGGAPDFSGSSSALSRSFEVESPKKMFDGSTGSPGTEQARGVSTLYGATMTGQSRAEMMANEAAMRGSTASGGEVDARGSSFFSLQMLTFGLLGGPGEAKTTAEDGQGGTVSTLSSPTSGAGGSAKSSTSTSLLAHILYALALLVDLGALIILVASPYDSASCDMSLFFALHTLCGLLLDAAQYIAGARAKWQRMIKAGCSNRFSSTSDDPLSISLRSTSVRTNVKGALVVPDGSPAAAASSAFYGLLLKYSMLTLYATFIGFGGYLLITSKGSCGSNRLYYADAALCASASIMLLLTVAASLAEWWATTVTTQGADKVASAAARTLPNFAVILGLPLVFCLTDHTCESKANAVVAGTLAFAAAIDAALCWASLGNDTTTDATDTYLSNVTAFALVAACGLTLGFWSPVCANATFYANIGVLSCILLTLSLNFALTALSTITTRKSASASSPDTDAKTNPEDEPLLASPALEV